MQCVCLCVHNPDWSHHTTKSQNPSAVRILQPRIPEGFGLEGTWKTIQSHALPRGHYRVVPSRAPALGRAMMSPGLLGVVCLDFCMELISSSAQSFGEGGQTHSTLCSGLSESPVLTLEMKSSVSQHPTRPGCPPFQGHGLAQVSLEDSVSVLEWFLLENIFSSHFWGCEETQKSHFFS